MPADQETIRYPASTARPNGKPYLFREVLGGGSGGRYYADGSDTIHIVPDSRNLPAEFTETRFPVLVEKLALRTDSGGPASAAAGSATRRITVSWKTAAPSSPPTARGWAARE